MNKKGVLIIIFIVILLMILFLFVLKNNKTISTNKLEAVVLISDQNSITIKDKNNIIYTVKNEELIFNVGETIILEYSGLLDKNENVQTIEIIDYKVTKENILDEKSMFDTYYNIAYDKLKDLTLDEKIGQLFLVRYPEENAIEDLKKYNFGGFVFYEKDFKNKTKSEVINMINELQNNSKISLLTAVDEEGGKVVRVSSNPKLRNEPFKSSRELYIDGGFNLIKEDTKEKSNLLKSLGINLNLAPVVDIANNVNSYIYPRTIGEDINVTSEYAKIVIEASKGLGVSYTLKHFPGYSDNNDTHINSSIDNRTYNEVINSLKPFEAGIEKGAEAVLVNHNIVNSIDSDNPASLSTNIHNLLRNELGFTGIIITDDLSMAALSNINKPTLNALISGNDLIITSDYKTSIEEIKEAINDNVISENLIDRIVLKNLAWKYYKGIIYDVK